MKVIHNIRVGKPDVSPAAPAHARGVHQGNRPRHEDPDLIAVDGIAKSTARRSTSINPHARNPVDPTSPNLSPS